MNKQCTACGAGEMNIFYSLENIPVHSVRLLWSSEEAQNFTSGSMDLAHCPVCGFIRNLSYNPDLQDYSDEYESTQAFSPTFNAFANKLAQQLIDRYDLHNKSIIEIGCGQGEFISLLSKLGNNRGTGFDPAYEPSRSSLVPDENVTIISDYYSEKYTGYKADFVCCKMTLEHIRDVADFIGTVRRSIGEQYNTTVFFQVPDITRILSEIAFWDIYYEHCSYFSAGSLARLFRQQGFDVLDLWRDYGNQYLMISARPAPSSTLPQLEQENDLDEVAKLVSSFTTRYPGILNHWKQIVQETASQGKKTILWGSGSKGVAFLTTLNLCDEIEYTVDVNPYKNGTFMAGTGQKVVTPDFLNNYHPDLVILMNPLYKKEVEKDLHQKGIFPKILSVGE